MNSIYNYEFLINSMYNPDYIEYGPIGNNDVLEEILNNLLSNLYQ